MRIRRECKTMQDRIFFQRLYLHVRGIHRPSTKFHTSSSSLFNFVNNHHQTITIPSMASAVLRRGDHHASSSFRRHQATSTSLFLSSASASVSRIENNRVHPNNNIHLQLHHYNCNSPIVYPMRQHHRMHPAGADIPYYQQRYDMITDELCYVKCAMLKHKTHDDDDDHRRS